MMRIIESRNTRELAQLLAARHKRQADAGEAARRLVELVRRDGDAALIRLAKRLDGVDLEREGFTVSAAEIAGARLSVPREFMAALRVAAANIRATARRQLPHPWRAQTTPGVTVGQIVRPLERVACYIPGGRFPLPSTVLMSVIPAQVAGVKEVVITTPRPAPAILAAASLLGVNTVYRLGGAHAIAALAYGTRRVPRVDKIVGPGNRYVAAAKRLVAGDCGIDMVAGPSELAVLAGDGNPLWIAADMVAQAEHDPEAMAVLVTPSSRLARQVQSAMRKKLHHLFNSVVQRSITAAGAIILTRDMEEGVRVVNELAPEHLTLAGGAAKYLPDIQSSGSIFLGDYSPVAAGDYASGTNHILPTGGVARLRGGLTAADFVKTLSVQRLSSAGLRRLSGAIIALAEAEGLKAHAHSIRVRTQDDQSS